MNNENKKIALIRDYFNLYLIILFIIFIKPQLFFRLPIMLGVYLTSAVNFLAADTLTILGSVDYIWTGLGNAMMKVKDAIYNVLL